MNKTEEKKLSQNIKKEINRYTVKKIFTTETAKDLAEKLFILAGGDKEPYKLKTGKNKGLFRIPKAKAYDIIIEHWDYNIALQFARNELMTVLPNGKYKYDKYNQYRTAERNYRLESQQDNFWANRQGNLDQTIQQINRRYCISRRTREKLVVEMALNQLSVTHFNALRNDFIEYEIFKNNSEVFPTLKHSAGLDYFVDGVPYDQKVSRSLGAMFEKDYDSHDEAVKAARKNPNKLAQSLFENQDVYRLEKGDICNRLYVVYLDESSFENIKFSTRRITSKEVTMVHFPDKPDCYKAMVVFV